MTDQTIIDDAFLLCSAALKHNERFKEHIKDDKEFVLTISIESATYVSSVSQHSAVSLFYSHLQTPFYLEKMGILKITPHEIGATIPTNPKGYYLVVFDKRKTEEFVEKQKQQFIDVTEGDEYTEEIWPDGIIFTDNTLIIPSYGRCKFSKKQGVNKMAHLVERVTKEEQKGITATKIKKSFEEKEIMDLENSDIDAMMVQINDRFQKEFNRAKVRLVNMGKETGNTKRIGLSVKIKKPRD